MDPVDALAELMEVVSYHAPPEVYWRAEECARAIERALKEGREAKAALDAALTRERAYREREERMARALAVIELEAGRARR